MYRETPPSLGQLGLWREILEGFPRWGNIARTQKDTMLTFRKPDKGSGQSSAGGGLWAEATHHSPLKSCSELSSQVFCGPGAHDHLFTLGGRGGWKNGISKAGVTVRTRKLNVVVWEVGEMPNCGSVGYMQVRVKWGRGKNRFSDFLFTLLPTSHSISQDSTLRDIYIYIICRSAWPHGWSRAPRSHAWETPYY